MGALGMASLVFVAIVIVGIGVLWRMGSTSRGRASKRVVLLGFGLLIVLTLLFPEVTTRVAELVGVGRGADLVFYLTSIGLIFLAALTYISHRRSEERIAEIVSEQAASRVLADWNPSDEGTENQEGDVRS